MRKGSIFHRVIAILLTVCILFCSQGMKVIADGLENDEELSKLYVSGIKMFYAESADIAKEQCEEEGYTFCPQNLMDSGISSVHAYIGYKTSDKEYEAITDLTLLDMKNSHYVEMTYEEYLDKYMGEFEDKAYQMKALAGEFRKQYLAGSPYALMAYDSLNMIYIDASAPMSGDNLMGNYLMNKADVTFFEKYMQRGDAQILNAIINALSEAASDYKQGEEERETWADRAKKSAVAEIYRKADSAEKTMYDTMYRGPAMTLYRLIENFADTYREAKERLDKYGDTFGYGESDGVTENCGADELISASSDCRIPEFTGALMTYELFDQIVYREAGETIVSDADYLYVGEEEEIPDEEEETADDQTESDEEEAEPVEEEEAWEEEEESETVYTERMTLAEYLISLAGDSETAVHLELLYPIIASMTQAQLISMELCGLTTLAKGLLGAEGYASEREESIRKSESRLKELGYTNGKIWLWDGIDQELYSKKVAETSEAIEMANSGKEYKDSVNADAREKASTRTIALQVIDISLLAVGGVCLTLQAIIGVSLWEAGCAMYFMSSLAMMAAFTGSAILYGIGAVFLCSLFIINIACVVVSLVFMIYMIMDWCGVFDEPDTADYDQIPNIVFHARENSDGIYRVRYDAVESNGDPLTMLKMSFRILEKEDPIEYARIENQLNRYYSLKWAGGSGKYIWEPDDDSSEYKRKTVYDLIDEEGDITKLVPFSYFTMLFPSYDYMRSDVADIAAFQGKYDRWCALYTTKAPAAGKPITVVPGESFFKLQVNNYQAPSGCNPVTLINGKLAADIHSIEIGEKKGTPTYMFIIRGSKQEGEEPDDASEDGQEEAEEGETADDTVDTDSYITRVKLCHTDSRELTINNLQGSGFLDIIDVNLTPYDGYTYIGFQYGSASNALTDIRVSSSSAEAIVFGEASYARCGERTDGMTPDGICLYATSSRVAGSPIKKITVETKRFELGAGPEPVCLFSGGNAVDFMHKWSDNQQIDHETYHNFTKREHIKTLQDDPVDGYYIYFWPKEEYKAKEGDENPPYIAGFSYFLAAKTDNDESRFGDNYEFMRNFAMQNGFMLVEDTMMSDQAAIMTPIAHWSDCEGGAMGHDWRYDIFHYLYKGSANNFSDGAFGNFDSLMKMYRDEKVAAKLYFGIAYTYNPYRAITDIAGLIAPYTETTHSIRYTGMKTPAGTLQVCNVSIQGNPINNAGICYGYYNMFNMQNALYTNDAVIQNSDIYWLKDAQTETLSRYLLTNGPVSGKDPIRATDLKFYTYEDPSADPDFVPICDMRTPGDYSHPMNFALDTVNVGSKYLYLYLRKSAGGRTGSADGSHNAYEKKHYVAAVFCGTGKTVEEAIANIYAKMSESWTYLSSMFPDIPKKPMLSELDEIIPTELSDDMPWYTLQRRDVTYVDPENDEWVYGNDGANLRWGHEQFYFTWNGPYWVSDKTADDTEKMRDCAYIGVVRTSYKEEEVTVTKVNEKTGKEETVKQKVYPAYGILKYYTDGTAPETLHVANVAMSLCGDKTNPIVSKEGKYYLYYSTNQATASFTAPITEIHIGSDAFINGYNTSYSCSSSDRVNNQLPVYSALRMRTDEQNYIHTKYDMEDLPYIENIYIGVGNTRLEALSDLIGTTNANAASTANLNYNSFSGKWIAFGYRRTSSVNDAINDVFLYYGSDPPEKFTASAAKLTQARVKGQTVWKWKAADIEYELIKHNLKSGADIVSINEGNGDKGLYLYKTTAEGRCAYSLDYESEIFPIRNIAFAYGDISPAYASTDQLAEVYSKTMYGMKTFDPSAYEIPSWEYVLGVDADSPEVFKTDGSTGFPMSLNYGILPMKGNNKNHSGDHRVMMYVDRGSFCQSKDADDVYKALYKPRENAVLSNAGYYSVFTTYGVLTQN